MRLSGGFEGQRQDSKAIAERVATYGLKVFCTDCGQLHRHRTGLGLRLRNTESPCCAARMRPVRWSGWAQWRAATRNTRRENPTPVTDPYVVRHGKKYFMIGFDSR